MGADTPDYYYENRIYTDYRIETLAVYRGGPTESVIIRQLGGTIGELTVIDHAAIDLKPGDEAIFFLIPSPAEEFAEALWILGAAQGHWAVSNNMAEPSFDGFKRMSIEEMEVALAGYLYGTPPNDMPEGILPGDHFSLDTAPIGLDLANEPPTGD